MSSTADRGPPPIFKRRESQVRSYCRAFPAVFVKAQGATLQDEAGQCYIDFLAGCSTLNYGHNHPDLKRALIEYLTGDGLAHGLDLHTRAKAEFLETFERLILKPRSFDYRMMFPGPTGANAVEAALKIARKVTGRANVIAFTNGFHGMTLGALSCSGNADKRRGAGLPLTGVSHEAFDQYYGKGIDTAALLEKRLLDASSGLDAPAAIIVETVQGEGGLNAASDEWLRKIAGLAKRVGALLIVDDIQAGIGRTGGFFSFERAGVKPDIVTLAKSLSGLGLPLALTLIKPEYDCWKPGEHNGTFRGNNHAFVTATKALEIYWADGKFEEDVRRKSGLLGRRLGAIAAEASIVTRVKGRGMMQGVEVAGGMAEQICSDCFAEGLIIETSGARGEVVKVLCPLTIADDELERGLDILARAIAAVEAKTETVAA